MQPNIHTDSVQNDQEKSQTFGQNGVKGRGGGGGEEGEGVVEGGGRSCGGGEGRSMASSLMMVLCPLPEREAQCADVSRNGPNTAHQRCLGAGARPVICPLSYRYFPSRILCFFLSPPPQYFIVGQLQSLSSCQDGI